MQKQIHLSWINAKIGIWLWRKMLPFRAVSSSQISFCVHVYINAAQPYWGPVIKVNNPSSFLGYSQRTGRDQHFPGSYRWHHKINSSNQYVLGGGGGAVHPGKKPEHGGQASGTMGYRQTRQDRPLGTLCRKIPATSASSWTACARGFLLLLHQLVYLARMACWEETIYLPVQSVSLATWYSSFQNIKLKNKC